jgi:hypothetical protein
LDRGAVSGALRTWPALPLALACLSVLGGCGVGAGRAPSGVQVLVSRDFGAHVLRRLYRPRAAGQETVMSLLMRNAAVGTRYGGGFVESIDGLSGGSEGGQPVDWFYYVNGVEARQGAAATTVHPGDRIWWDRHDWSATEDVPAVVGSFPEPFLDGLGGKRLPVRVECETPGSRACQTVLERLRVAGVPAAVAAPQSSAGPGTLRVLVGLWRRIAGDPVARMISRGPRASGVYAEPAASAGGALVLLGANGAEVRALRPPWGLVAATRNREEPPVWVVAGSAERGVELAASAFGTGALAERFAVAVTPAATLAAPAGGG